QAAAQHGPKLAILPLEHPEVVRSEQFQCKSFLKLGTHGPCFLLVLQPSMVEGSGGVSAAMRAS
ncbi:MAG: hypothetical protein KDC10_14915, partial [Calditrichaeota bacterium]|nr:hypothetical protein [Calditrichota bacterium]